MAATIEIKYFNSFWVKKQNSQLISATFPSGGTGDIGGDSLNDPGVPNYSALPFKNYDTTAVGGKYPNLWPYYINANNYNITAVGSSTPGTGFVSTIGVKPEINYASQPQGYIIEEARIRGGFNNASVDYGVKAYLVDKEYVSAIRQTSVIYSGLFNSNVNINETNVFSQATNITFVAPPEYGGIQKLYTSDTKLHIFQKNKVSRALLDKDAIYNAAGQGTPVSTTKLVIGEINPYVGEYGISTNPESWAQFGNRQYFSDKDRNAIMRLANDGLTTISKYGMNDFFRDTLSSIEDIYQPIDIELTGSGQNPALPYSPNQGLLVGEPNIEVGPFSKPGDPRIEIGSLILIQIGTNAPVNTGCYVKAVDYVTGKVLTTDLIPSLTPVDGNKVIFRSFEKDKILGAYDVYNDNYLISTQKTEGTYDTLVFDEKSLGWVTFYDYKPEFAVSLFNKFYSTNSKSLWLHNSEDVSRNSFYGANSVKSSIEFVFNLKPNIVKTFKTLNYEGTNGWEAFSMISDQIGMRLGTQGFWENNEDSIKKIHSYTEGLYIEDGISKYAGFNLKENRYVANLVNDSLPQLNEVIFGKEASGMKGYFATVKIQTDETTAPGQMKELFAVGSEYVMSSY